MHDIRRRNQNGGRMLMANAFAASAVAVLAVAAPPPAAPLTISALDTSAYPRVTFDIVVPRALSAVELEAGMVDIDGAAVESLTAVDPRQIVVALVIDDRAEVSELVVLGLQGATVELVRNVGDGTRIALATPSGLRSALTADRTANIARIAGITAGAPAVASLPQVVTDSITELGASGAPDRHAIVALGTALDGTDPEFDALAGAVAETGTTFHVIAPQGVDARPLVALAQRTGGVVATDRELLASVDAATAAIARRYRVVSTVATAGAHRIALTVDEQRYAAEVDLGAPAPTASSTSAPVTSAPAPPSVATPTSAAAVAPVSQPTSQATTPTAGSLSAPPQSTARGGSGRSALSVAVLAVIALGSGALTLVLLGGTRFGRRGRPRRALPPTGELGDVTADAPSPSADAATEVASSSSASLPATADDHRPPGSDADVDADNLVAPAPLLDAEATPEPEVEPSPRRARSRRAARRRRARSAPPAGPTPAPVAEQPADAEPTPAPVAAHTADAEAASAGEPPVEDEPEPVPAVVAEPASAPVVEQSSAPPRDVAADQRVAESEPTAAQPSTHGPQHDVAPGAEPPAASGADRRAAAHALRPEPLVAEHDVESAPAGDPERELDADRPVDPERRTDAGADPFEEHAPPPAAAPAEVPPEPERSAVAPRAARRTGPVASPERRAPRSRSSARRDEVDDWIDAGHLRLSPSRQQAWTGKRHLRLTPHEYRVLELLVTSGSHGVTTEEIIAAGGLENDANGVDAAAAFVARLRRKTGFRDRARGVRKQRTVTYYLDDIDGAG